MMEQLRTLALDVVLRGLLLINGPDRSIDDDQLRLPPALLRLVRRKLDSVHEWLGHHGTLIRQSERFVNELAWERGFGDSCTRIDRFKTVSNILDRRRADLNSCERFELSAVYCLHWQTTRIWPELSQEEQQRYLAERMHQHDPICIFWTGVCARQPWLSDSYLVRAFYWAAEHDYSAALEYFWDHIVQERADAVTFRAVRAFQLAACRGHLASLLFLWRVTDDEQHRQMIQGTLSYTQGAFYAFESACKDGQYELVKFIFQEADYQQRQIILRAEECRAFRLASENGHLDVVRLFLERSKRMNLVRRLLEAENCYAFRRALSNGGEELVRLIWSHAEEEEDRRNLLTSALYSEDMRSILTDEDAIPRIMTYIWTNSTVDSKSAIFSRYIMPRVAKNLALRQQELSPQSNLDPISPDSLIVHMKMEDMDGAAESAFFDVCNMADIEEIHRYMENKFKNSKHDHVDGH